MDFQNYVLKNTHAMEVHVTNFGGIITKIITPDRSGEFGDVTLGFESAEDYQRNKQHPYFGALIGRYGNRINHGKFTLDGKEYSLAQNFGAHHLHGGVIGFDKVFWGISREKNTLSLFYLSRAGEEGYPGSLRVKVSYELTEDDELKIIYEADTDSATPVNLTQHSYFNLSAMKQQTILDHVLQINADEITAVTADLIPTGEMEPVSGTEFDFTIPRRIRNGIYDHNFVLRGAPGQIKAAATLYAPESGRCLEVFTTEPGLQFYSGNFLDGSIVGKEGHVYQKNAGLCLETQHFPDSPNHANFPSTILRPGKKFLSTTIYKFSVK